MLSYGINWLKMSLSFQLGPSGINELSFHMVYVWYQIINKSPKFSIITILDIKISCHKLSILCSFCKNAKKLSIKTLWNAKISLHMLSIWYQYKKSYPKLSIRTSRSHAIWFPYHLVSTNTLPLAFLKAA